MKYRSILLLIICIGLIAVSACSKKDSVNKGEPSEDELQNLNDSAFPIVKEKISLDFFAVHVPEGHQDWNDVLIFNEYEDKTNVNIDWEMVSSESYVEKRNLALGGGSLPDVFYNSYFSMPDLTKYGSQGVFIPLNDLIENYAPNFKKLLEENPTIEKAITAADGNIYAFPTLNGPGFTTNIIGARPYINKKWLDALDMDMPETTEEFYQYLKAVKEKGPSNGKVEEVPFGGSSIEELINNYLLGSFGLANKGLANTFIDRDPDSGDLRFYPVSEQYKEMLEYVHKLYDEGLIEKNIFSIDHNQFLTNLGEGRYGSVVWYPPEEVASKEHGKDYVGMPMLEGPYGDKTLAIKGLVDSAGALVITNKNKYPATTVRWADYFYSEEGMKHFFMGVEGKTHEIDDDGNPRYMDHITNSKDNLSLEEEVSKYLVVAGGGYPAMKTEAFYSGVEVTPQALEAVEKLEPNIMKDEDTWAPLNHTKEELDQLLGFGTDIEKYVKEMRDKFIAGEESFANWDKYLKELDSMGLDKYIKIKQDALDRQLDE